MFSPHPRAEWTDRNNALSTPLDRGAWELAGLTDAEADQC